MTDLITHAESPFSLFHIWMGEAQKSEPSDPDAACLATVDDNGYPNARVVLIRKIDERGFCFFTNTQSQKGQELNSNTKAAINFHWKTLKRQIRIRGDIERVSDAESDAYYVSRPLGNRIGAWASLQSQTLGVRQTLVDRVAASEKQFGDNPPRPPHWGGYRIIPASIEFWQESEFRLHQRTRFDKDEKGLWVSSMLYP